MALDGWKSNLPPEAANYLTRLENQLKKLETRVSSSTSSVNYLTKQSASSRSGIQPGQNGQPFAQASGVVTLPSSLINGANASVNVVFPTGRFTVAPNVTISVNSSRLGTQIDTKTDAGFRFLVSNFSGATASPTAPDTTLLGFWTAVQMTEDSASG